MTDQSEPRKHTITYDQLVGFAKAKGRDVSHVFRVFKGERKSEALSAEFETYFGFPMTETTFAGRRGFAA